MEMLFVCRAGVPRRTQRVVSGYVTVMPNGAKSQEDPAIPTRWDEHQNARNKTHFLRQVDTFDRGKPSLNGV
jgi:hypothetical protein